MVIAVASGKGGTGKTTIAVNLAYAIGNAQIIDCDVEEPNAHLFLSPEIQKTEPVGIPVPVVDDSLCDGCGKCGEVCEFSAIVVIKKKVLVFPELCHGCGACAYFCPRKAIREEPREIGRVEQGSAGELLFVHGVLNIGEPMAPPLIRKAKKHIDREHTVVIDAPPGTSCPVVESVKGADFCVLVTEPTPFGLNDLTLAVEMVRKLGIPLGVVINSCTIGNKDVEDYCNREGITVLMRFPWDRRIAEQYSAGRLLLKNLPEYAEHFSSLLHSIQTEMAEYEATHCHQR